MALPSYLVLSQRLWNHCELGVCLGRGVNVLRLRRPTCRRLWRQPGLHVPHWRQRRRRFCGVRRWRWRWLYRAGGARRQRGDCHAGTCFCDVRATRKDWRKGSVQSRCATNESTLVRYRARGPLPGHRHDLTSQAGKKGTEKEKRRESENGKEKETRG